MSGNHNYNEPWSMYSGEDEPWKDLDRLLKLNENMDTQAEIGDALGCTPSTISYWLQKAKDNPDAGDDGYDDIECVHCEGDTPGPNLICDNCLMVVRAEDYEAEYDDYNEWLENKESKVES